MPLFTKNFLKIRKWSVWRC